MHWCKCSTLCCVVSLCWQVQNVLNLTEKSWKRAVTVSSKHLSSLHLRNTSFSPFGRFQLSKDFSWDLSRRSSLAIWKESVLSVRCFLFELVVCSLVCFRSLYCWKAKDLKTFSLLSEQTDSMIAPPPCFISDGYSCTSYP